MAIYRNIHLSFWTDTKVLDDFSPEDKYFYLYLLTNPYTKLCGCYEISISSISKEMGYTEDAVRKLIERFQNYHNVIWYDEKTKEIFLKNWSKYNWTDSPKFKKAVEKEIMKVKSHKFKKILEGLACGDSIDTVWIRYLYPMDTTVPATDTVTVSDNNINIDIDDSVEYGPVYTPPVISILLSTGEECGIYQEQINKWQSLYPAVNVLQELRKMSGWSDANPQKRKSISEIRPFINRWLAVEQDKASQNVAAPGTPKSKFRNFEERRYAPDFYNSLIE